MILEKCNKQETNKWAREYHKMHSFQETRIMPYKHDLIDKIIMDIEKYPEFLPWCKKARIISKNDDFLTAELSVEFKGFTENYVSKVVRRAETSVYYIEVVAISGPFKLLKNIWSIKELDNKTKVDFSIDFEFKSRILDMVIGMFFSTATEKMIGAFEARAEKLSAIV
jgi:coenzyme Q-binding protein COQ10